MTLETWVKEQLMERYPTCFTFDCPVDVKVLTVDHMQFIKGSIPEYIENQKQVVNYLVKKMFGLLDKADVVIVNVDRASPDVKKIVCHGGRYERRCKQCKEKEVELPHGRTADASFYHPECDKGCQKNQILWYEEGPHLSTDEDAPLKFKGDWMKFASDSRNLQYELYPRMANEILKLCRYIPAGKMLFVNGLPFKSKVVDELHPQYMEGMKRSSMFTQRTILDAWSLTDLEERRIVIEPKVYAFEAHGGREIPEMANDIHEADNAVFFFSRFFPEHYRHMAYINDGDAISIGMMRAIEDFRGPGNFAHEQWLCLPYRAGEKKKALMKTASDFQYINLTQLCQKIEETPDFVAKGVQSPIATIMFLIILSETDFFQGEFCFGISGLSVWNTFFEKLDMFTHLVQYYPNDRNLLVQRRVVIDEDLWKIFVQLCYAGKYESAYRKKRKVSETDPVPFENIRLHCSASIKDARRHPPTDEIMVRWARQIAWNANYWANAWRNIYIDPFEEYKGRPYFGYTRDLAITNAVSVKQKKVDEVYKRHFLKRKQKAPAGEVVISKKQKKTAVDLIRGKT